MNGEWSFHTSPNNSLLKFNSCVGFVTNTQTYSRRPHAIRFYVYLINSLSLSSLDRLSSTRVSGHNNKSEKKKQPPCQSHSRCMCMCFQIESNITSSECRLDSVYAEQSTLQDAVFCVPQKYEGIVASASCCTVHTHTHTTHSHTVFFLKFLSLSNFGSVSFCCCCYCFGCEFFQFEREKKWKPHWIQLFSFCRLDNLSVLCVIRLLCSSLVIRDKVNICQIFCEWIFFSLSSI